MLNNISYIMYYSTTIKVFFFSNVIWLNYGPGSSVGTTTDCGGKVWPGGAADHSPPSSAAVMEE